MLFTLCYVFSEFVFVVICFFRAKGLQMRSQPNQEDGVRERFTKVKKLCGTELCFRKDEFNHSP